MLELDNRSQEVRNQTMSIAPLETREMDTDVYDMVETLIGLLHQEYKSVLRVATLVKKRLTADARHDFSCREACLDVENEALLEFVLVERERIAALTEIGLALGLSRPSRLRIAELVFHVTPELRDELLDVREDLRDLADELDGLRAASGSLEYHNLGRVTLYTSLDSFSGSRTRWLIQHLRDLDVAPCPVLRGEAEPSVEPSITDES